MGNLGTILLYLIIAVAVIALIVYMVKRNSAASNDIDEKSGQESEIALNKADQAEVVVEEDNDELIAVISAAVAAALGKSITRIKVRSIRRVEPTVSSWTAAGRSDQMSQRF